MALINFKFLSFGIFVRVLFTFDKPIWHRRRRRGGGGGRLMIENEAKNYNDFSVYVDWGESFKLSNEEVFHISSGFKRGFLSSLSQSE